MIDAEVKWIDWVGDFPTDFEKPCLLAFTAGIGERGTEGADNFQVVACNTQWLHEEVKKSFGIWPRGILIVESIDADHVKRALQVLATQFRTSGTWVEFAERMNRYLLWEYEDMDDYQGQPIVPPLE